MPIFRTLVQRDLNLPVHLRNERQRARAAHIKKLDDCFGQFLVRVICACGACREIEPEALARLVGWTLTLKELAQRMRCSRGGKRAAGSGIRETDLATCIEQDE